MVGTDHIKEYISSIDVNFWIGISLSITGSLLSTVSLAMQRLSHKRNQALPLAQRKPDNRQVLNVIGVFSLFVGSLVDCAALGFAPATIISCMGSLTLVFNMILAPWMIQETVYLHDVAVNIIVMIGTLISVWFGPHETPSYDLDDLMNLVYEPTFIMYQTIFGIWLLSLVLLWMDLRHHHQEIHPSIATTSAGTILSQRQYLSSLEPLLKSHLLRFTYPALAGSIGGITAAFAKASIELVKTSVLGDNQFIFLGTYIVIGITVLSVTLQVKFLNAGLKSYEALYIVPVYQVFWIISGILAGMFYFHEVRGLTEMQIRLFSVGAGISITGIILHSKRRSHHHHHDGDEEDKKDLVHVDLEAEKTHLLAKQQQQQQQRSSSPEDEEVATTSSHSQTLPLQYL